MSFQEVLAIDVDPFLFVDDYVFPLEEIRPVFARDSTTCLASGLQNLLDALDLSRASTAGGRDHDFEPLVLDLL